MRGSVDEASRLPSTRTSKTTSLGRLGASSVVADPPVETRLAGLTLVTSGSSQFAALAFIGDAIVEELEGNLDQVADAQRLARLADGVPIVSDAPRRAFDALVRAGARLPVVWDVLELAALLAPACPSGGLDRAGAFFGIVVDGVGLVRQAQRAQML